MENIENKTVIAIDVLRATSTIITALAAGAKAVYAIDDIEAAKKLKQKLPQAILCGERKGNIIPGFQLGNSPFEFTAAEAAEKEIISCTTNGTVAICTAAAAQDVWLGALINAPAVAAKVQKEGKKEVLALCSGTNGRISLDDLLGAGSVIAHLVALEPAAVLTDAAKIAAHMYENYAHDLLSGIKTSAHGQKLLTLGYEKDLHFCSQLGSHPYVPQLIKKNPPLISRAQKLC
ncbi:MAG: 2-phosphosulfolactate phosphatase [Bacillota bacterium]